MPEVLIIEDESVIREAVERLLNRNGLQTTGVESVEKALASGPLTDYDLILADVRLPGRSGLDIIAQAGRVPVVIMTSYASVDAAVEAMRRGAVDYIAKPFDNETLRLSVESAIVPQSSDALPAPSRATTPPHALIAECPAMQAVCTSLKTLAASEQAVWLVGEPGSGQSRLTRMLHHYSPRARKPLITVRSAAIPAEQVETAILGRKGLLDAARGGSLFIDAIDQLPLTVQAQLARALPAGTRVCASAPGTIDELSQANRLEPTLRDALSPATVRLPALRERGEDILSLANDLLLKAGKRFNRPAQHFSEAAEDYIRHNPWPGNIIELKNVIERAVINTDTAAIDRADLAPETRAAAAPALNLSLAEYFQAFVRAHEAELTETELARRLGLSRKALWERRQKFGLERQRQAG